MKRCTHRYKGLYGYYQPRTREGRDGYTWTDYKCQIIGCNHWKPTFKNKRLQKK